VVRGGGGVSIIGQRADTALPDVSESAIIAAACRLIVSNHLWPRGRETAESDSRCERDRVRVCVCVCECAHYYYNTKNNTLSTTLLPPSFHTYIRKNVLYNTYMYVYGFVYC